MAERSDKKYYFFIFIENDKCFLQPSKARQGLLGDRSGNRQEIAGVLYDTNVLGFKGPRRMTGTVMYTFRPNH